jgi:hypothetical protein
VDDEIVGDGAAAQIEVHGAAQEYETAHSAFPVEQAGREKESEERRAGAETGTRHGLIMAGPEKESEERRAGAEAGELADDAGCADSRAGGLQGDAMHVLVTFTRIMKDKLQRARQAGERGAWREAAEQLHGDDTPAVVNQVIGGWQGTVTIWDGAQRVAGQVRPGPEEAEEEAYQQTYRYLRLRIRRLVRAMAHHPIQSGHSADSSDTISFVFASLAIGATLSMDVHNHLDDYTQQYMSWFRENSSSSSS